MYSIFRIATLLVATAGMVVDAGSSEHGPTTWEGVKPPSPAPVPRLPSALEPFNVHMPTIFDDEAPSATDTETTVTSVVEESASSPPRNVGAVFLVVIGAAASWANLS